MQTRNSIAKPLFAFRVGICRLSSGACVETIGTLRLHGNTASLDLISAVTYIRSVVSHTGGGNQGKIRLLPSRFNREQGQTGYGIDAQRTAVANYLDGGNWQLLGEFVEVESGRRNDAPNWTRLWRLAESTRRSSS